jgi:nitroreductase
MDYSELFTNRRSIRNFKDKPVATDVLLDMIRESTFAPNAANSQQWKFVVVNSRDMIRRISDESKKNLLKRIEENPSDFIGKYEAVLRKPDYNVFYNAPALIIIAGPADYRSLLIDSALCAAYLMYAAVARGLGTCWVNLGSDVRDPQLRSELGLSDELKIVAPIITGFPESIPSAPRREPPVILKIIDDRQ